MSMHQGCMGDLQEQSIAQQALYTAPADVDMPGATAKLLTIATVGLNASPACMPDEVSVKLHLMETKQE